jgi:hypothetical protein
VPERLSREASFVRLVRGPCRCGKVPLRAALCRFYSRTKPGQPCFVAGNNEPHTSSRGRAEGAQHRRLSTKLPTVGIPLPPAVYLSSLMFMIHVIFCWKEQAPVPLRPWPASETAFVCFPPQGWDGSKSMRGAFVRRPLRTQALLWRLCGRK